MASTLTLPGLVAIVAVGFRRVPEKHLRARGCRPAARGSESIVRGLIHKLSDALRGERFEGYPACPKAQEHYVLTTSNMVHFDLLDGYEECGGVEMKGSVGDDERWAVHVYGVDVEFPSLRKARAWLGKPRIDVENV